MTFQSTLSDGNVRHREQSFFLVILHSLIGSNIGSNTDAEMAEQSMSQLDRPCGSSTPVLICQRSCNKACASDLLRLVQPKSSQRSNSSVLVALKFNPLGACWLLHSQSL